MQFQTSGLYESLPANFTHAPFIVRVNPLMDDQVGASRERLLAKPALERLLITVRNHMELETTFGEERPTADAAHAILLFQMHPLLVIHQLAEHRELLIAKVALHAPDFMHRPQMLHLLIVPVKAGPALFAFKFSLLMYGQFVVPPLVLPLEALAAMSAFISRLFVSIFNVLGQQVLSLKPFATMIAEQQPSSILTMRFEHMIEQRSKKFKLSPTRQTTDLQVG